MRTIRTMVALACAVALALASATPALAADWKGTAPRAGALSVAPQKVRRLTSLRVGSALSALSLHASATDDNFPGDAKTLPFSLNDSLDPINDWADVYKVTLSARQVINLTMSGSAGTDFDLYVFPPGTTSWDGIPTAWSEGDASDESIVFGADVAGDYYIVAYCPEFAAAGTYSLNGTVQTLTGDDDIPGTLKTVPFSLNDSLDHTAPLVDADDVFQVHLEAGQTLNAALTNCPQNGDIAVFLWNPSAVTVWGVAGIVAGEGEPTLRYTAPVAGNYYIDVAAYPGWAGTYTLTTALDAATSITIKTAATSTYIGRTVRLSGLVTPQTMIGVNIVVYVMKPGKTYWTYSSNRTVYTYAGSPASWVYPYYFKRGMARGYYKFKARCPAPGFASSAGYAMSESTTIQIRVR